MSALLKLKNKLFSTKARNKVDAEMSKIQEIMKQNQEKSQKTMRIVLLGCGDTGKTTIVKMIKKISDYDFENNDEIMIMKDYIKRAVVDYMKLLCYTSPILHHKHNANTLVKQHLECMRQEMEHLRFTPCELTKDLAAKIKTLWDDAGIKETLKQRHYYQIHDNVAYFLDKIDEIASDDYTPSFEDHLRIRTRSTGFSQCRFSINYDDCDGEHMIELTDVGGGRSGRKKWIRLLTVDMAVIYVVDMASYNLKLFEDNKTNRLVEAIDLFKAIISRVKAKYITIYFNKYDLFIEKIATIPITVAFADFPDCINPNDEKEVVNFVAMKFVEIFEWQYNLNETGPLQIFCTTALDKNCIENVLKDTICGIAARKYNYQSQTLPDLTRTYRQTHILLVNGYIREVQQFMGGLIIPLDIFVICFQFYFAKFIIK